MGMIGKIPTSVELFSGAGGLALGVAAAGFKHRLLLEYNRHACATLRANQMVFGADCLIHEGDVRTFDFTPFAAVDLLAAGAPCQPFSIGGRHRGDEDERNLFPQVFRAQRELGPKAVLIENVKGLLRPNLSEFVEYIERQLALPTVVPNDPLDPEGWRAHLQVLRSTSPASVENGNRYVVQKALLNAADFGVPQRRERVFFVAVRADLGVQWTPPVPTHSGKQLRGTARRNARAALVVDTQLEAGLSASHLLPWVTVREALAGLPEPAAGAPNVGIANHVAQPGARSYPGHTGSPLDEPAKTLKAGVHGVPGGENMLRHPDGRVRYFTVREAARIQSFPDEYVFCGAWTEAMRQLGNAVPVSLAAAVATSIRACLEQRVNRPMTASVPAQLRRARARTGRQRESLQQELLPSARYPEAT